MAAPNVSREHRPFFRFRFPFSVVSGPASNSVPCSGVRFGCSQKFRTSFRSSFSPLFLGFCAQPDFPSFPCFSAFSAFSGFQGSRSGIPVFPFFPLFPPFPVLRGPNPEFRFFRFFCFLGAPNPEFRGHASGHVWCGHVWRAPSFSDSSPRLATEVNPFRGTKNA